MDKIRINKYLSEIGYCSRRKADELLGEGRILVNGMLPQLGEKVSFDDEISVDGAIVSRKIKKDFVYLAFHKPVGIVCTTDTQREKNNIIDYIDFPQRIFPIGRLDKPSEGLILLTSDGDIVNKILRAKNFHEKEYIVRVNRPITEEFINRMKNGIPILGTVTRKCEVEKLDIFQFRIILTQGFNRQIRRMCEYLGYEVKKLKRIRIMNIRLDLPIGKWRHLTNEELKELNFHLKNSEKTAQ